MIETNIRPALSLIARMSSSQHIRVLMHVAACGLLACATPSAVLELGRTLPPGAMHAVAVRVTDGGAERQMDVHAEGPIALQAGQSRVVLRAECFSYEVDFEEQAGHQYAVYACGGTRFSGAKLDQLRGKQPNGRMIDPDMNISGLPSDIRVADETSHRVVGYGGAEPGTYAWFLTDGDRSGSQTTQDSETPWPCRQPRPESATRRVAYNGPPRDPVFDYCASR